MGQRIRAEPARGFLAAQTRGGTEPSPELVAKPEQVGWPMHLIKTALACGAGEADLIRFMDMGITPEQAREFMAQGGGGRQELDLSWMYVPTEWNTRAKPTKHGLTLEAINIGRYGEIPDT